MRLSGVERAGRLGLARWLRVGLGLRLLFGFLLITGLAGFFVLRVFLAEVKPSVREAMEDLLVDSANLLAELAAPELAGLPPGADLQHSRFAEQVRAYGRREVSAEIWGFHKQSLDLRVSLTDAAGRVVFDSGPQPALGQDYSRWRDVARTLRGEYGARSTRDDAADDGSTVMHVAAPVRDAQGRLLGVLTLAKPNRTVAPFIERAEAKIGWAGALLLALSMAVGLAVTFWTVRSVRRLRSYAQQVGDPARDASTALRPPALPGELGDLALAMDAMRQRLAGRAQLEQDVRALTHELKGPLTAIQGAAEFLQEPLNEAERERFGQQITEQVERLRTLVDGLLALSKLEGQHAPARHEALELGALTEQVLRDHAAQLDQRGLQVCWGPRQAVTLHGDPQALALACSNLLLNACQHAPAGSCLHLALWTHAGQAHWALRDEGPGVPDFALPQLGQRFFATANPVDGRRGSGLGLAIVQQVVALHGGRWQAEAAEPGLRVTLSLPLR